MTLPFPERMSLADRGRVGYLRNAMTVGMLKPAEVDDTLQRMRRGGRA